MLSFRTSALKGGEHIREAQRMTRSKLLAAAGIAFVLWAGTAWAQVPGVPNGFVFGSQSTTTLAVTHTPATVSISSSYPIAQITNPTTSTACVAWGASTITPPSPCPPQNQISPGQTGTFATILAGVGQGTLAAQLLTSGATGTLSIVQGYFLPIIGANGGASIITAAPYPYQRLGCQSLPSMATATGFTAVPAGATLAEVQMAGENVNFRDDGTAPTASTGLTLFPGALFPYTAQPLSAIEFIQQTATATGWVCFYK